jgi:hypothetical protein
MSNSRTHKRHSDYDEDDSTGTGNAQLDKILEGGVSDAYKRPWHRLERGLRLNRLRQFVQDETDRMALSEVESMQLLSLLHKSLEKKNLNSKTTVVYDLAEEKIKEIKGLVSHREADGILKYKFIEKKVTASTRRRATGGAGASTPQKTE